MYISISRTKASSARGLDVLLDGFLPEEKERLHATTQTHVSCIFFLFLFVFFSVSCSFRNTLGAGEAERRGFTAKSDFPGFIGRGPVEEAAAVAGGGGRRERRAARSTRRVLRICSRPALSVRRCVLAFGAVVF